MANRVFDRAAHGDPYSQTFLRALHRVSDKVRRTGRRLLGRKVAQPKLKVFHESDRSDRKSVV